MKKRILSVLVMSALILSMTACGTSTDAPEATEATGVTTTAAEEEKTEAETEAPAETEETTTTTEAPKEVQKITSKPEIHSISDRCMIFEQDGTTYVYNIADNKMYTTDEEIYKANGCVAQTSSYNIYNLETKETYDAKLFNDRYLTDYIPVYKIEESFEGTTYMFGIIDKNGDWALPLSADYEICKLKMKSDIYEATESMVYINRDIVYDWRTDTLLTSNDFGGKSFINYYNNSILLGEYIDKDGTYRNIEKYDMLTKETTSLYDGNAYVYIYNGTMIRDEVSGKTLILDRNLDIVCDASDYNVSYVQKISDNYVTFLATNDAGNDYAIMLDKNGNKIVEPFMSNSLIYTVNDYAMFINAKKITKIINCKTGEMTDCNYELYSVNTGTIVVESEGAYYIADISDPDTLINPFEIAE